MGGPVTEAMADGQTEAPEMDNRWPGGGLAPTALITLLVEAGNAGKPQKWTTLAHSAPSCEPR